MDDSRTVWCGNLSDQVTEELLYELFLQVAPLERVKIPTDREGRKSNFGFITFKHEASVNYAVQLLNGIRLYDKNLNIRPRNGGVQQEKQNIQNLSLTPLHKSFSYPNEGRNSPYQQNQHIRFNEPNDMAPAHVSYDDLIQMGPMMNMNYDYPQRNYGHNNRPPWDRNSHRDRERERKDHDRPRHEQDRDRRNDYSNNRNRNKYNHEKRNNSFDRGNRRNNRRF